MAAAVVVGTAAAEAEVGTVAVSALSMPLRHFMPRRSGMAELGAVVGTTATSRTSTTIGVSSSAATVIIRITTITITRPARSSGPNGARSASAIITTGIGGTAGTIDTGTTGTTDQAGGREPKKEAQNASEKDKAPDGVPYSSLL